MPEKILAGLGLNKLAVLGMIAMVKPIDGTINWRALGMLIAILTPLISAVGIGGMFVGGLTEVPEELKRIDSRLDHIETDIAVLKVQATIRGKLNE